MQMYAKQDEQASLKALFPPPCISAIAALPAGAEGQWADVGEGSLSGASFCPLAHPPPRRGPLQWASLSPSPFYLDKTDEAQRTEGSRSRSRRTEAVKLRPGSVDSTSQPHTHLLLLPTASPLLASFLAPGSGGDPWAGGQARVEPGHWPGKNSPREGLLSPPLSSPQQPPFLPLALAPWPGEAGKLCPLPPSSACPPSLGVHC